MAEHYESNQFYDTFDPFDSNAQLAMEEHYESSKAYDAFNAFDYNGHLVMEKHYESKNSMMLFMLSIFSILILNSWWHINISRTNFMMLLMPLIQTPTQ